MTDQWTELITAARASSVGTNGEAGSEQKPVVTELARCNLSTLKEAASRFDRLGRTHHEIDDAIADIEAALSRQAQTGNGEGGA